MEAEHAYKNLIWKDADRMSGQVCFYGTRIPVAFLFDYLERGDTIEAFSQDYRIAMETVKSVVELAREGLDQYLEDAA
jgi:uncharacterized protein (DUF433 family)